MACATAATRSCGQPCFTNSRDAFSAASHEAARAVANLSLLPRNHAEKPRRLKLPHRRLLLLEWLWHSSTRAANGRHRARRRHAAQREAAMLLPVFGKVESQSAMVIVGLFFSFWTLLSAANFTIVCAN